VPLARKKLAHEFRLEARRGKRFGSDRVQQHLGTSI
jgi:hypothetical protein